MLYVSLRDGVIWQFVFWFAHDHCVIVFSLLRLPGCSEYIRCLTDLTYSPKIIHYSGAPKPTDFLFKRRYYELHEVKMEMTAQERPPCVPWVDKVESIYEREVIDPQIRRHDRHLRREENGQFAVCPKCLYPSWTDKNHTSDLCRQNLECKRGYRRMSKTQVAYDKMATRVHVKFLYEIVWPSMVWWVIQMVMKERPNGSCPGCSPVVCLIMLISVLLVFHFCFLRCVHVSVFFRF